MKRKCAWLLLPLVLCALTWGAKWRADHPTPMKEDLEVRALMAQSFKVGIVHDPRSGNPGKFGIYWKKFPKEDLELLINCFSISHQIEKSREMMGRNGLVSVDFFLTNTKNNDVHNVFVDLNVDSGEGVVTVHSPENIVEHNLHPITARRWISLLLNHPQIGPELRARLNQ